MKEVIIVFVMYYNSILYLPMIITYLFLRNSTIVAERWKYGLMENKVSL